MSWTAWAVFVGLLISVGEARAATVRLQLESVRVIRQREVGGDRPYFATIKYRSRMCRRRSTTVEVLGREPHDWVSKPQYNRGRLRRRDHMSNGESLPIPSWMGDMSWDEVALVPLLDASGRVNPEAVRADVLGAVIISFDNNNTPPHVVRGLLRRAADATRQVLEEEVESCRLPFSFAGGGSTAEISRRVGDRFRELLTTTMGGWDLAELFLQLTVGSTFNPDQPTGINVLLMPALTGIPESRTPPGQETIRGLPGGPVQVHSWTLTPGTRTDQLAFEGSAAHYTTPIRLTFTDSAETAAAAVAQRLVLRIRTGGDDLRGGTDNVYGRVQVRGRWSNEVLLNRGPTPGRGVRWADNTSHDASIPLPAGTQVSDIQAVRLRTSFGGGIGGDNWNMESIRVEWRGAGGASGLLVERAGRPYRRFTGDNQELEIRF